MKKTILVKNKDRDGEIYRFYCSFLSFLTTFFRKKKKSGRPSIKDHPLCFSGILFSEERENRLCAFKVIISIRFGKKQRPQW